MLLVTGDQASCDEGRELLGEADDGRGQAGARLRLRAADPARAGEGDDQAGARAALGDLKAVPPYHVPGSPCEVKVEFKHTAAADKLRFHPGVERLDGRTIRVEADTWWEAWKLFFFET